MWGVLGYVIMRLGCNAHSLSYTPPKVCVSAVCTILKYKHHTVGIAVPHSIELLRNSCDLISSLPCTVQFFAAQGPLVVRHEHDIQRAQKLKITLQNTPQAEAYSKQSLSRDEVHFSAAYAHAHWLLPACADCLDGRLPHTGVCALYRNACHATTLAPVSTISNGQPSCTSCPEAGGVGAQASM